MVDKSTLKHSAIGVRNAAQWEKTLTSGRVHQLADPVDSTTVTRQKMSLWPSLSGVQIQWASSAMSGIGEPLTRRQIGTLGSPGCWAFWPKVVAWGQAESSKFAPSQPDGGAAPWEGAF